MKTNPFARAPMHRSYISLIEFCRESGLKPSTVRDRAMRGEISRHWVDYRREFGTGRKLPNRWMYWVGSLPEECGSAYLVNHLEREISHLRREAENTQAKLERVIRHRRSAVAA